MQLTDRADRRQSRGEGLTKAKALERLDAIRAALAAVDRVELRQGVKGDVAAFTLTLTPAVGLRK